jgi:nitrate/nitrite transport system ATP-binding protein
MVYPSSMHNLTLRYWLASGGIDPDQDVSLTVIPPPQMVSNLKAGNIDGYCVGEPWNSRAVNEGHGFVVATDLDLFPGHIEKVLGVREEWANKYPQTHLALVKALLEACQYCDDQRNREEIVGLLAQDQYVGSSLEDIRPGFIDAYDRGTSAPPQMLQRYNQFFVDRTNYPERVEILWVLTQMARWGLTPGAIAVPSNYLTALYLTQTTQLATSTTWKSSAKFVSKKSTSMPSPCQLLRAGD